MASKNEASQKQNGTNNANIQNTQNDNTQNISNNQTSVAGTEAENDNGFNGTHAGVASKTFSTVRKGKLSAFKAAKFDDDSNRGKATAGASKNEMDGVRFIYPTYSFLLEEKEQRNYKDPALQNLKSSLSSVDCPVNGERRNDVYVEGFMSPDYSIRKVNAPANRAYYLSRKDSMESRLASFTAGIRFSKSLGQNLMFKTGLQYSQINEKFSFRTEDEKRLTTVVTIRTISHSDGSTSIVRDTSIIEQIGYRVKTSYNKYRSLDVPVIFGYEFGGGKWRGAVNLGAILNLSSWQQGETLDTSFTAISFNKNDQAIFKKHVGMGLFGSVSLIKSLSPSFDVFAEPYLRYNLSSLTNSNSPFNQKFHVAGVFLGVRYKLNSTRQR